MPKPIVNPGCLDELAAYLLKEGIRRYNDPVLRIGVKMAETHIVQALTETIGPGTKAGEFAGKLANAAQEFERKFIEARAQIAAEDSE